MNDLITPKKTRKIRSLTSEHKMKISQAHKGKKKNHSFANRKRPSITPTWFRIPVICINTGKLYNSLAEAAEEVYQNKHSYTYISEVCKGIKPHYKKLIWIYEQDYISLSESEKKVLKIKCLELRKPTIKYKTKLLYTNNVYDSFADLGLVLHNDGLLSYRNNTREDLSKLLSTLVGVAKKKLCPFVRLKDEYVFWADYEVFCKDPRGAFKISERPIHKDVKELYECYIECLDKIIGDVSIGELLNSSKGTFYKLDNMYYKNESNLKKYAYDEIIDKKTLIYLKDNSNYKFLFDIAAFNFTKITKNKFYMKNNYIFLNRDDYINRFIRILTKEEVLKELSLIFKM